jgi:hypothetical protein
VGLEFPVERHFLAERVPREGDQGQKAPINTPA